MFPRLVILFFVASLVGISPQAYATCDRALANRKVVIDDPFWNQESPIFIITKSGKKLPVTYSFDTELHDSEIYARIYKDPELLVQWKAATQGIALDIDTTSSLLQLSRKQFLAFAVRKGAVISGESVQLADLYPRYVGIVERDRHVQDLELRQKAVQRWLGDLKLEVGEDGVLVEVRHTDFESTPHGFKEIMETLHSRVNQPQTHFHIAFPSAAISRAQFLAIARAMETRSVLQLAMDDPDPVMSLSYHSSYLYEDDADTMLDNGGRGVVKAKTDSFGGEIPAHDLELRQWSTTEQAMEEIKIAAILGQEPEKIRILIGQRSAFKIDEYTQNLEGALEYAGSALSYSKSSKLEDALGISKELLKLADEAKKMKQLSTDFRGRVAKFLKTSHVLEHLDVDAFRY